MLTTEEAAKILGVTRRRVQALLEAGTLEGVKTAGVWFAEEGSVHLRLATANKRGGRPAVGSRRGETRFTLMNRTHEIAEVVYNSTRKAFSKVGDADAQHAPIGLASPTGHIALDDFNAWWRGRGIPQTRLGLAALLSEAGVDVPEDLLQRNLGLSLSDQYWIRPIDGSLTWEDVNFFNNSFEKVSLATEAHAADGKHALAKPDNTSDGNLQKSWECRGDLRVLIKSGASYGQEPYNEVVATALHERLLEQDCYVAYSLEGEGALARCSCPVFLTDEEEYVPAVYVERALGKADTNEGRHGEYDHYLVCCESLGAEGVQAALDRMIVCDDLLANHDRHFRNFGLIRNVETLACRPAPIFDSGSSLWCDVETAALAAGEHSFVSKQFFESPARQMLLVDDLSWFNTAKLDGFVDQAIDILALNDALKERLLPIRKALTWRVERMRAIVEWS